MMGLIVISSKRAYATCCMTHSAAVRSTVSTADLFLHRRRHSIGGDTQTLKGRSGSVSVGPLGPGSHKVLFEPSFLAGMGCDYKCDFVPLTVFFGYPLPLDIWYLFWWAPTFSCQWLFISELQFWSSHRRR